MFYINPVYSTSCPDPFVLKFCGEYWCYSTGWAPDGRVFEILHSFDLIHWESAGGAMEPLLEGAPEYWAPEVSYYNGVFYLYYTVGDGVRMRLRAAVASSPEGPYQDSGRILTPDEFAIDPHVFEDDDGKRYLFYARDFLGHSHIGTGTVVDRMIDALKLEGKPNPVTLPHYDWQVFDPHRIEKDGVRWHTVEGPFVLKHKGRYYQMFSGGNWKNLSYGVSYAFSDFVDTQQEWTQLEHGKDLPLVLSTIPGKVIGPGHNSVIRGQDNRQLFCVYHRWTADENFRLLSIDRLEFVGERVAVLGPTTTPQEAPLRLPHPTFREISGQWQKKGRELVQDSSEGTAEILTVPGSDCFLVEITARALPRPGHRPDAAYGLRLLDGARTLLSVELHPSSVKAAILIDREGQRFLPLPGDFSFDSYHLLRLEVNGSKVTFRLDGGAHSWTGRLPRIPRQISFFTREIPCSFRACELTRGFEDDFFGETIDLEELGWSPSESGTGKWKINRGEMLQTDSNALNSLVVKAHLLTLHELVINARLQEGDAPDSCYGFYPMLAQKGVSPLLRVEIRDNEPQLAWFSEHGNGVWRFPRSFDRRRFQQFRVRHLDGQLHIYWEAEPLGTLAAPEGPSRVGLYANRASVGFDLVRVVSK